MSNSTRYAEAEPLFRSVYEGLRRILGDDHPFALEVLMFRAFALSKLNADEGERLMEDVVKRSRRALGTDHRQTLTGLGRLAAVYFNRAKHAQAEPIFEELLEKFGESHGEDHPQTIEALWRLGYTRMFLGRYAEAEIDLLDAAERSKRVLGEDHPRTLSVEDRIGELYRHAKRYAQAERTLVSLIERRKRVLGEDNRWTLVSMLELARVYQGQERFAEAAALNKERLAIQKRVLGEKPDADANALNDYARALLTIEPADLRDPAAALPIAQKAVEKSRGEDPDILDTLALAQHLTGDTRAAIETEKKALSLLPPNAPGRGDYEAALAKFEAALEDESK